VKLCDDCGKLCDKVYLGLSMRVRVGSRVRVRTKPPPCAMDAWIKPQGTRIPWSGYPTCRYLYIQALAYSRHGSLTPWIHYAEGIKKASHKASYGFLWHDIAYMDSKRKKRFNEPAFSRPRTPHCYTCNALLLIFYSSTLRSGLHRSYS